LKALAAAALLAWALSSAAPGLYRRGAPIDEDTIQSGEMLLHGFNFGNEAENFHLPLASVSGALIVNHSPAPSGLARAASAAAAYFLILALGVQLGSLPVGLLGAALLLASSRLLGVGGLAYAWHGQWGHLETFHTLLVLAVAGLCARHARLRTRGSAAAAALALGAALLYRSTLAFFPPLLALLDWTTGRRDARRTAILGLAPYLFLLPWIAMNWSVHRAFIPLEHGEAAPIIVGGVLGSIDKPWPRVPASFGLDGAGTAEVLAWAAPRIAAHPADFAVGCLRRLRVIAALSPALFILGLLSFIVHRRRPEFQAVGLLCAYFVLIHCPMSFLHEYFEPLWPVLAVAAAALPFSPSATERKASDTVLAGFLACVLLLCLFVYGTLAFYAYAAAHDDAAAKTLRIEAAIRSHPDEGELYFHRGMIRFRAGETDAAARDLETAARLRPENGRLARRAAWIGLYRREPAAFERWRGGAGDEADSEALLLKTYGRLSLGDRSGAREAASRFLALDPAEVESNGVDLHMELRPFVADLCRRRGDIPELAAPCRDNDRYAPTTPRIDAPPDPRPALAGAAEARAAALTAAGRRAEALAALAEAWTLRPSARVRHHMAILYQELGELPSALGLLEQLSREEPGNAAYLADLGLCRYLAGRERSAISALKRALALDPRLKPASLTLSAILAARR
jgi:tetratricopeptide (TPR) repeat protein